MGAIKAAVGDAVITFLWMFCVSTVGALTGVIASALQVQGVAYSLLITTTLIFLLLLVFNPICDAIGGASFNPTATAAFYAAGFGEDNLVSMAFRFPAQAAGAVGGVLAIAELMPPHYKHTLSGPSLKVDLHTGAAAEGVLTFCITLAVLWIVIKGPSRAIVKNWLLAVTTVAFVLAGAGYTGPSMNPANLASRPLPPSRRSLPYSKKEGNGKFPVPPREKGEKEKKEKKRKEKKENMAM